MSKFNTSRTRAATFSPITSETTPSGRTHEGGPGYSRDTKGELFLLAVTNLASEHTYYENADERDRRYTDLVRKATLDDPEWTARFLRWLRNDGNMRSASLIGAAEFTKARIDAGLSGMSRQVVASVLQRADEPGELLAYWTSTHGRAIPKPIKRGVADAVARLYNERSLIKYDSSARGFRFGDVLELVHPTPAHDWQGRLFSYAIDRRHHRDSIPDPAVLPTIANHTAFRELVANDPSVLLDSDELRRAGMTWEAALSLAGSRVDKARLWEALIPSMGYMALLRNLRNFDEAGVSDETAEKVAARLADPEQVARSRQFPMRFLAAHQAAPSLRWAWPLEKALMHSLANVPALSGRTLVLVDRSGSMFYDQLSARSNLTRADAAAIFGTALAMRCERADLIEYGTTSHPVRVEKGGSLLRLIERFGMLGGTETRAAVAKHYRGHDRVVIVTDEQAYDAPGDVGSAIPAEVPLYTWNLAGYRYGHAPTGGRNRHVFGGLTDAAFRAIPLLESGSNADWPF